MDSEAYLKKLDALSWGFRISKLQERGQTTEWHILYVNPKDRVWYSSQGRDLRTALKDAVDRLERAGVKGTHSTGGLYNTDET